MSIVCLLENDRVLCPHWAEGTHITYKNQRHGTEGQQDLRMRNFLALDGEVAPKLAVIVIVSVGA